MSLGFTMHRRAIFVSTLAVSAGISGCGAMINSAFQEKYAKPASATRVIGAPSAERAVKAVVAATGETGWTPKTVSVETGYVLAEFQPLVGVRSARDYAYKLEARIPNNGKGDLRITVTPPTGVIADKPTEQYVTEFLDAVSRALMN